MFLVTKTSYIFICTFIVQVDMSRAKLQFDRFQKVLSGSIVSDNYLLARECSGSPGCSLLSCAKLCGSVPACKSFSFGTMNRECLHFTARASGTAARATAVSQDDWATWEKDEPNPCLESAYTLVNVIYDVTFQSSMGPYLSDDTLVTGWYRFQVAGASAVITTTCKAKFRCATRNPVWLDLQGGALPEEDGQLMTEGCGGQQAVNCCTKRVPVTVHNCSSFLVYKLVATDPSYRYCTQQVTD